MKAQCGLVLVLSIFACLLQSNAFADAVANPGLFARDRGIENGASNHRSLRMESLKTDVNLRGSIAQTTITAHFLNPGNWNVEGEFSLALPEGSVVTGYALDIDGRMIDGVLADLPKAMEIYEDKVRRGVDPGIATVSRGRVFSTRVFPIFPGKGRTIRVVFVSPVDSEKGWTLPLVSNDTVGRVSFDIHAESVKGTPLVALPLDGSVAWMQDGAKVQASFSATNRRLSGEFKLSGSAPSPSFLISEHRNGKKFFQLTDTFDAAARRPLAAERVRIYWDRSRSRRDQSLQAELALLRSYLTAVRASAVDVVTFNSSGAVVESAKSPDEALQLLSGAVYRGATSFDVLANLKLAAADSCILFSDGVATVDSRNRFKPDCRLNAITSVPDADRAYLSRLVRASGGAVLTLDSKSATSMLAALQTRATYVADVRDQNGASLPFAVVNKSASWVIVGEAPSGPLVVMVGSGAGVQSRRYDPALIEGGRFDGEGALWAADRIGDLAAQDGKLNEVRSMSKLYSVASAATAFLVLETPDDYASAGVSPPKNYPAQLMKEYRVAKAERDAEAADEKSQHIQGVVDSWNEQVAWWNTRFEPRSKEELERQKARMLAIPRTSNMPPQAEAANAPSLDLLRSARGVTGLDEIVVTGSFIRNTVEESAMPVDVIKFDGPLTRVELAEWNPKRPYLAALDAAAKPKLAAVLLAQEKAFGTAPAFYLDTAEWFNRKGRKTEALELLLSALDLPARNRETISIVADRLLRYGQYDRAVWLYEDNLQALDHLPQPRRTLAMALIKRSEANRAKSSTQDLLRAVRLLNEIVTRPWDGDYDGIDLIALMDANAILPRLKALGVTKFELDSRLIQLLDVDLRVVVEWNTGDTDMDLWIDEPNGERVIYSNPRSSSGGRLSNDMTSGFGPEEYLLHRAPAGKYQIRLNVYAPDSINPNGATIVTAHLIRDFGRPTQKEETIDLELSVGEEGERKVGEFTVENRTELSQTSAAKP